MDQLERAEISRICDQLICADTKGELGILLARELKNNFSLFDLQIIGGRMKREVDKLPSPYREAIRPYFIKQIFDAHHRLLLMDGRGDFRRMEGSIADRDLFRKFLEMIPDGCYSWDDDPRSRCDLYRPWHRFFYYLISVFVMFVLDEPGHPVGTPFPGHFTVEKRTGEYFCPIRDKEEDVSYSICTFCPAKQSDI